MARGRRIADAWAALALAWLVLPLFAGAALLALAIAVWFSPTRGGWVLAAIVGIRVIRTGRLVWRPAPWAPPPAVVGEDGGEWTLGGRVSIRRGAVRTGVAWLAPQVHGALPAAITHAGALDRPLLRALDRSDHGLAALSHLWLWRAFAARGRALAGRARSAAAASAQQEVVRRHGVRQSNEFLAADERAASFDAYWTGHVLPCLRRGFAPPIVEGWQRFLEGGASVQPVGEEEERVARDLLALLHADDTDPLVDLPWEQTAAAVWIPLSREILHEAGGPLAGHALDELPELIADPRGGVSSDGVIAALIVTCCAAGWQLEAHPGARFLLRDGEGTVDPVALAELLVDDPAREVPWGEIGIGHLRVEAPQDEPGDAVPTGVPAAPARSLPLARVSRPWRRASAVVVIGALGLLLAVTSVLEAPNMPTALGTVLFAVVGAALGAGCGVWAFTRVRLLGRRGRLTIDGERLIVEHPGLLRRPLSIERGNLRLVAIDDDPGRLDARFPVGATGERPLGGGGDHYLWVRGVAGPIGTLSVTPDAPNVALVFQQPIAAPRLRHRGGHSPLPGEAMPGLLLALDAPHDARASLRAWDVVRPPSHADTHHILAAYHGCSS